VNEAAGWVAPTASNVWGSARHDANSRLGDVTIGTPSRTGCGSTTRPGSRNGKGLSTTASTTLNTAVVAPMPIASVTIAAIANDRATSNWRTPDSASRRTLSSASRTFQVVIPLPLPVVESPDQRLLYIAV